MLSNSVRFLVSPLSTHSFPLLSLFRFGILILVPNFLKIRPILAKERKRERKNVRFSRITRAENNRIREGNCIREASCHEPHVQVSTEQLRATLPFRFLTLPGHLRPPPPAPLLATVCRATREECKRIHSTRELFFPRPNSTPIFNHPLYRDHFCPREESTLRG